mmetsp:Transcript_12230/g.36896  ORF Transcript_12230/g.36896 Transcript_12230/m.36896 type:complete len:215 (-) Transcript_12230:1009-1653(-)
MVTTTFGSSRYCLRWGRKASTVEYSLKDQSAPANSLATSLSFMTTDRRMTAESSQTQNRSFEKTSPSAGASCVLSTAVGKTSSAEFLLLTRAGETRPLDVRRLLRSRATPSTSSEGRVSTIWPGKVNENSVPPVASSTVQTFVSLSHTSPPTANANTLHDDNPRPTPRQSAVATSSLNRRDAIESGMPRPESLTANSSNLSLRCPLKLIVTAPT